MPDSLQHSLDTYVYVQFGDGKEVFYLGDCAVVPTLPSPSPDRSAMYSSIGARGYNQIGFEPNPPSSPTLAITTFVAGAAHYLERVKEAGCPFNLYVLTARCGANQALNSYERAYVYRNCEFAGDPIENAVSTEDDKLTEHVFNVTAWSGRVDHRPVTISRIEVSQTGSAWSVDAWPSRCASDCEEAVAAGQQVVIGAATVGGAVPDIYYTLDGATWITQASSFAAAMTVKAVVTFQDLDGNYGGVVVRDQLAGNSLRCEVGIIGTTTLVNIGATPAEGIDLYSTAFALDARHVWICTDDGRVYFSSDGALTWVEQASAVVASGGNSLSAIRFVDALVGYSVGHTDTVLSTTDGGETWTNTPTGLGEDWLSLVVFGRQRLLVGCYSVATDGCLYMSQNAGDSWENVTPWPTVAGVTAALTMEFLPDGLTGYVSQDTATSSDIYKSINGGRDWRRIETPVNNRINALAVCQPNLGYAVGIVHNGTTFIAKISG